MAQEQEEAVAETRDQNDSPVAATSDSVDKNKNKKKTGNGFFSRIWNAMFRDKGDDFAKRLEYISKEEASVVSRIKRRSITWRKLTRNLVLSSLIFEVSSYGFLNFEFDVFS